MTHQSIDITISIPYNCEVVLLFGRRLEFTVAILN